MPVFTETEYRNHAKRPELHEAWERLPVVVTIEGVKVRWVGPLVDLGHDVWLGDLSNAAWGYLECCGWASVLREAGSMLNGDGEIRDEWATAFGRAARRLADEGSCAGPVSDPNRWGSWIAFAMSEPHRYVKALSERNGWER